MKTLMSFIVIITLIVIFFDSCTPKYGCEGQTSHHGHTLIVGQALYKK